MKEEEIEEIEEEEIEEIEEGKVLYGPGFADMLINFDKRIDYIEKHLKVITEAYNKMAEI